MKQKNNRTYFRFKGNPVLTVLMILSMLSCSKQMDWQLIYQEEDMIVVEGKITSEKRAHEVKLTRPVYEMNITPDPVTGAQVVISDGNELYSLAEDPGRPGIYLTDSLFSAVPNMYYQLRITYHSKFITAVTTMVEVTQFQHMSLHPVASDSLLLEAHIGDSDEPAIVRLELDWSQVPGYDTLPASENHALIYHYTLDGVDVNKIFKPAQEHVWFPHGTTVIREKESVNNWYGEFLRGMLSETDWRGGMFDVLPGNARTNMIGDAIGFFTAADVIRDTIVVE
jgi:hypothetical protein